MLLKLIEENRRIDYVVFYNTGMEFDCIYRIRDMVLPILKENGIEYVELSPEEPFIISMLVRKVNSKNGVHYGYDWCGGRCRWGTTAKMKAISAFKKSVNDDITDYVGIAADEVKRFDKAQHEDKVLPLVEYGMTEKDCLEYCYKHGFFWEEDGIRLYDILDRISCWCCANKNLKELKAFYMYLPKYWNRLKGLQSRIDRPFHGYYKGNPVGIFEIEERFSREVKD